MAPSLFPWQAAAIEAFEAVGGLFAAQPPGAGKTLVGALCAGTGACPVVLLPARLLAQTRAKYREYGVNHATFSSYTALSRDPGLLERLSPDVLILDEFHYLKNVAKAALGKQVARYVHAHPRCKVVVLSGAI